MSVALSKQSWFGAALGMLPVFWAMGAALLVSGWIATRGKDSKR